MPFPLFWPAVTPDEVNYLYGIFLTADLDASGGVNRDEFYEYFGLDESPYADRVFRVMGALPAALSCCTVMVYFHVSPVHETRREQVRRG